MVVPALFPGYWLTIAILALIYAIEAMGLNLLMGFTGLDSLGQAAFFGLGSYGLGILTVKYGVAWWPAAIAAIAIGTAGAAIIGAIAVRTRGLYFLLITAAMGQVLWGADYRWGAFTGGCGWTGAWGRSPLSVVLLRTAFLLFHARRVCGRDRIDLHNHCVAVWAYA